jgi:hypothetical protein
MDKLLLAFFPALDRHLFKRRWVTAAIALCIINGLGSSVGSCMAIVESDITDYEFASLDPLDSQFASEDLDLTAE